MKNYLVVSLLFVVLYACQPKSNKINYQAIGIIESPFNWSTGAPRQALLMPESKAVLVLNSSYAKGLDWLDEFEYIWLLSHFNEVESWDLHLSPPASNHLHEFGVFATRSPRRPNPIGLSLVKLDSIIGNRLYLSGIDLFDQTPILDIKPYLPSVDYVRSAKNSFAEIELGHHDEDFLPDSTLPWYILGKDGEEN